MFSYQLYCSLACQSSFHSCHIVANYRLYWNNLYHILQILDHQIMYRLGFPIYHSTPSCCHNLKINNKRRKIISTDTWKKMFRGLNTLHIPYKSLYCWSYVWEVHSLKRIGVPVNTLTYIHVVQMPLYQTM